MSKKYFNLGLIGKRYIDMTISIESVELGETNNILNVQESLGGIFNIKNCYLIKTVCQYFPESRKKAFVINEKSLGRRTSFTTDICPDNSTLFSRQYLNERVLDWLHISYIDDIKKSNRFSNAFRFPISVDFCTTNCRHKFLNIMQKCSLIFDSRERKNLYNDISLGVPIIFHDQYGCECVIRNKVVYSCEIEPLNNIHVNGAGDIFASIFIEEYNKTNIKEAVLKTCGLTTKHLI